MMEVLSRVLTLPPKAIVSFFLGLIAIASQGLAADAVSPQREMIRLNSGWTSTVALHGDSVPLATAPWVPTAVPEFRNLDPHGGSHDIWYRTDLKVPPSWTNRKIMLDLKSARYHPRVFIDGVLIADRMDGWSPLLVDLTARCKPGETHRLDVSCQDWAATFADGYTWPVGSGDGAIHGKVIAPVGGYKDYGGLVFPVYLESRPVESIQTETLRISTSVRNHILSVSGVANRGSLEAVVYDGDRRILDLGHAQVLTTGSWSFKQYFAHPHFWSPEDPHLYRLQLTLRDPKSNSVLDRYQKKFGFRELWAEGPNFILNGVPRHLFASASWPVEEWLDRTTVHKRIATAKASGIDTFRLHIGPWQEEFVEAADEQGLMIVEEAGLYTDSGLYGYLDPRFWANYGDFVAHMIARDRNHPAVIMWSLGNEILFMGNDRNDAALPEKLGRMASFARTEDPSRLNTFEADLDPGKQFDVIGLHYPHELPNVYAYPNAADWLGSRNLTEAAGGMLGEKRSSFVWDRKKPLYIGEYLWCPQGDYSPGTVYYGDDAYLNRDAHNVSARDRSWIDQTIAYRRSGVSGLCPWTTFGFGMDNPSPENLAAQKVFFRRQAAYPRDFANRYFSDESTSIRFDVFNDSSHSAKYDLRLSQKGKVISHRQFELGPAGYSAVSVPYRAPKVRQATDDPISYTLTLSDQVLDSGVLPIRVFPVAAIAAIATSGPTKVVVYDPSGKWPSSARRLPLLDSKTVLVIAANALTADRTKSEVPIIGTSAFDSGRFRRFLSQGGRCIVLEQESLADLDLGVQLVDHASTMTFALDPSHPLLSGIDASELKFWRGDGFVTRKEIRRDAKLGLSAITVSGGPDSLAQAAIAEMSVGIGHVVFVQCLAGERNQQEPVANRILSNALAYVSNLPSTSAKSVLALGADADFLSDLRSIGLRIATQSDGLTESEASGIVVAGGGSEVRHRLPAILQALKAGKPVYWHRPPSELFGTPQFPPFENLHLASGMNGPSMLARQSAFLRGVSREDLIFASTPRGWDRQIELATRVSTGQFLPYAASNARNNGRVVRFRVEGGEMLSTKGADPTAYFQRRGDVLCNVNIPSAGSYMLGFEAKGSKIGGQTPTLAVQVDGTERTWLSTSEDWANFGVPIALSKGENRIAISYSNGPSWNGPRTLSVRNLRLGPPLAYPKSVEILASPSSAISIRYGAGMLVADALDWSSSEAHRSHGQHYLNGLLANLGFAFDAPSENLGDLLPTAPFATTGGRYNTADASRIELRSNGTCSTEFSVASSGRYRLALVGSSTPCQGVYALARVSIDGIPIGDEFFGSETDTTHFWNSIPLSKGHHRLEIAFINDASTATEDRNLTIHQIGFRIADSTAPAPLGKTQ